MSGSTVDSLKAPFPWFGGKSRAASLIWPRFGDVANYVEPFAGSLAVLLARPHAPRIETVNDLDCYLANFWRACAADPEQVARFADSPVNEADLHARHRWLVDRADFRVRVRAEPEYFDAKIAGWWVWGLCAWIGSGWCATAVDDALDQKLPHLGSGSNAPARRGLKQQLPHLVGSTDRTGFNSPDYGKGINAKAMRGPSQKLPLLGGTKGTGVHRRGLQEPPIQIPRLGGQEGRPNYGAGIHCENQRSRILDVFQALSERLRYTRVACGDFERVLSDSVTWRHGTTAILLDPEYSEGAAVYAESNAGKGEEHAFHRAARWAAEHGEDKRLRICLCGYEGTWAPPGGWTTVPWKAKGGYGGQRHDGENVNAKRERLWFSPGCLRVTAAQGDLFAATGAQS